MCGEKINLCRFLEYKLNVTVSFRIWTQITDSIYERDNRYISSASSGKIHLLDFLQYLSIGVGQLVS